MVILGIDPGLERTGFGVVRKNPGGEFQLLDFGCIMTSKNDTLSARLGVIAGDITEILLKWRPQAAVVEEIFFSKNVKTAMKVSQARGVTLEILEEFGIPIQEVKPQHVKMAVSGYGKSDKLQMQKMVQMILKMPEKITSDDAVDALACCLAYSPSLTHDS